MNKQKTAELYRMVMPDHTCPYGLKSKALLEREGYQVNDHHLETREETDAFKTKHAVETTPQTFIGGKRIGGHDDVREFFGKSVKDPDATSYQPVIAIFAMTFLMAVGAAFVALAIGFRFWPPNGSSHSQCVLWLFKSFRMFAVFRPCF